MPDALPAAILRALAEAEAEAPSEAAAGLSLPRLGKRLGLGASAVMRQLTLMGDATLGGVRGPGWVRVVQQGDRWVVHLTDAGRTALRFVRITQERAAMTSPSSSTLPVAVVTGAARGIGLAITNWFLAHGHRVLMLDVDEATLSAAAAALNDEARVLALPCDVSQPAQVQTAIDRVVQQFGRIDCLVNNAGIASFKPIGATSFEEWRAVMAVNLDGAFLCSQACVPVMLKTGGGAIVNIASISGLRASTLRVAYGTSKAALIHLTRQQAVELGTVGIRVNAIAPGPVETEMAKKVHSAAIRADYHDTIPLGRYGTMDEIASAVGFLCSPAAGYVNGQVLAVDGGFEAAGVGLPTLRREAAQGASN